MSKYVGQSVPRVDARAKVTGEAIYAVDVIRPGMLHAAIVRSERAHATLLGVETSSAAAAPGVVGVFTADDLRKLDPYYGHIIRDHPVLAIGKVRFMGEPVALVVATSRLLAQRRCRKGARRV